MREGFAAQCKVAQQTNKNIFGTNLGLIMSGNSRKTWKLPESLDSYYSWPLKMWRQSGSLEAKYKDFYCTVIEKNKLHLSFSSFFLLTHLTVVRQFGTICPFIPTKTMFDFQNTTNSHCRCIMSCGVIKKMSVKYRYCVLQHSHFLKFFHKINFSHYVLCSPGKYRFKLCQCHLQCTFLC